MIACEESVVLLDCVNSKSFYLFFPEPSDIDSCSLALKLNEMKIKMYLKDLIFLS